MEREDENYDFEERAAIREYDGDQPRGTAEFFAHEEIAARTAQQNYLNRRKDYEKGQQQNDPDGIADVAIKASIPQGRQRKPELQELIDQRDEVGKQMRAETNEQRKDELIAEWLKLTSKIIELRKGT